MIPLILKEGIILHLDGKGLPLEIQILDASGFVSMDEFNIMIPTRAGKEFPPRRDKKHSVG